MKEIVRVFEVINKRELKYLFKRLLSKIMRERIDNFTYINQLFANKSGLEVGGPSSIFRNNGFVPIYKVLNELDGCNFSNTTIWEGDIKSGDKYNFYKNKKGLQYISEASDLSQIPDSKYDFVISSNCLEHIANPLKALAEWIRVVKDDGLLLLVLPNKKYCFDHKRQVTEFSHLLSDFRNNINEDDLTHLNEILELHDLKMDKPAGSLAQFKERSLKNFYNRTLHHHVFDISVLEEIARHFKLTVMLAEVGQSVIILANKNATLQANISIN